MAFRGFYGTARGKDGDDTPAFGRTFAPHGEKDPGKDDGYAVPAMWSPDGVFGEKLPGMRAAAIAG